MKERETLAEVGRRGRWSALNLHRLLRRPQRRLALPKLALHPAQVVEARCKIRQERVWTGLRQRSVMLHLPLTPEQIHLGLRAMKTVAVANRTLTDEERELLSAVAETLGSEVSVEALEAVSPEEVAEGIPDPDARDHVAQMLVFTAQIDGAVTSDELRVSDGFAGALGIESAWLDEVREAARAHLDMLRLDMVRRAPFPKGTLSETWDDSGWKGLWGLFRTASQSVEDVDLAWRHKVD